MPSNHSDLHAAHLHKLPGTQLSGPGMDIRVASHARGIQPHHGYLVGGHRTRIVHAQT